MRALPKPRCLLVWSIFNWAIWTSVLCLVCSQFLGIVWNSAITYVHLVYGRSPFDPLMELSGLSDEAYSDRAFVCIKEANAYVPKQLSAVLADPNLARVVNDPSIVDGYRVVKRETVAFSPQVYDSYTETWLQKTGGKWRHGWYEDTDGTPWISNMVTSKNGSWLGVAVRFFDTLTNKEMDAAPAEFGVSIETWGQAFTTKSVTLQVDQAFLSNGKRFGLFFFEDYDERTTTNAYSLETFISNVSIILLLFRWFVAMATMVNSYRHCVTSWQTTGIGCLSSSRSFNILPFMLLPRLKMILTVFCTTGCLFEGQQRALGDAWYVMYPGIVEILFFYYSLLNILGKITYRRFSDAFFGPTLILLWALHYFRIEMAQNGWFGIDGRISTLILSADVDTMKLSDFITTDVALRLNGKVRTLLLFKLIVLALNLLPLIFAEKMTVNGLKSRSFAPCAIENALALRASNIGGLGRSPVYARLHVSSPRPHMGDDLIEKLAPRVPSTLNILSKRSVVTPAQDDPKQDEVQLMKPPAGEALCTHVLLSYELDRLGYLVFGGKYLISYNDWYVLLSSTAPLRVVERLWNYRISVFEVIKSDDGSYFKLGPHPCLCRLDESVLRAIPFYDVTVCSFR